MPNESLRIFLTGATGYIGGTVLTRLLSLAKAGTFHITVLVRSASKASIFNNTKYNLDAVIGSYEDLSLLRKLAGQADYVFACVRLFGVGFRREKLMLSAGRRG